MLPSDLLLYRYRGETIVPKYVPLDNKHRAIAQAVIDCCQQCQSQTQGALDRQLAELEGNSPDYRLKRGLAHLLKSSFCTFEVVSPLDPPTLRQRAFTLAAETVTNPQQAAIVLRNLATTLSHELGREIRVEAIRAGLYADLPENRILTDFDPPTADALLHRYNLSQVQGIFYRATQITITAHRNDPGEYKLLFRYLKLFQLMAYIEGDADHGFTITIDGPSSLFKPSTRYGLAIAKLLPALLHVSKWSLHATLQMRDTYSQRTRTGQFSLNSDCGLVSHYPAGKPYDSMLEAAFADRWQQLKTDWRLEREVDLIPIPGSVMIPDFRLVHPDGRTVLLEIIGYWRSEYLRKKFSQIQQARDINLMLAISERLNLAKAGINPQQIPVPTVWFKDKLQPKAVLAVLENWQSERVC
ncbi:DUF790 family protein [Trichothermofontia sp.]